MGEDCTHPERHKPGSASMACARGRRRSALGYGLKPGIAVALPSCANARSRPRAKHLQSSPACSCTYTPNQKSEVCGAQILNTSSEIAAWAGVGGTLWVR